MYCSAWCYWSPGRRSDGNLRSTGSTTCLWIIMDVSSRNMLKLLHQMIVFSHEKRNNELNLTTTDINLQKHNSCNSHSGYNNSNIARSFRIFFNTLAQRPYVGGNIILTRWYLDTTHFVLALLILWWRSNVIS
jgi:hypothetical protein